MAILGIDYGASKIGLAKSDSENNMAFPIDILKNTSQKDVLNSIQKICKENDVNKVVVGIPVSLSGEIREIDLENKQMQEILDFVETLKEFLDLPVETEDERLSTKMANSMNKGMIKNGADDDIAAMLILQTYLDKLK